MGGYRLNDQQARQLIAELADVYGWKWIPDKNVKYPGTSKPWPGICGTCNKFANPRLDNLKLGRGPCNSCKYAKQKICQPTPSDQVWQEVLAYGFLPAEPYKNAMTKWQGWCIKCHRSRGIWLTHLRQGISACPSCNVGVGDDQAWDDADIFYLIRNPETVCFKFGITRRDVRPRLSRHKMIGYTEVIRVYKMQAPEPVKLERKLLSKLKERGARPAHGREFFNEKWLSLVLEELPCEIAKAG